jgi:TonB family protein
MLRIRLYALPVVLGALFATAAGQRSTDGNPNVIAPVLLVHPDPQCPAKEGVKLPHSRRVDVYLWVEPNGMPDHLRIAKSGGPAFDENALATVQQYRYQPATLDGKTVKVDLYVSVYFHC